MPWKSLCFCATAALAVSCSSGPSSDPEIYTPRWAFEPWISKDISDGPDTYAFVEGFESRDIPVGVVVLDSPWETNYNSLEVNEARYPNFNAMVSDLRDRGVRVVLWITQMVNESSFDLEDGGDVYIGASPNFREGLDNGYFVNDGDTYIWWKGRGSAVDFFNPDARRWWREQQNALLDAGVAGWKLDFGESYIAADVINTFEGPKTLQEYSEEYYRDFYVHGMNRLGREDFVTMVRPYDESYGFAPRFFARKEHAPVSWVGDNRRDWFGLEDALDHTFRSAAAGYVVVGSDIGGYLDRDDLNLGVVIPWDTEVFARWTAMSAMTPFMQLHGRANIAPWSVPERAAESEEMYRYWATLHHELVPFFYSLACEAYANDSVIIFPEGEEANWAGDYRFRVGEAFFFAPFLSAGGVRDILLPAGDRWYDWFSPENDALDGGQTLANYTVPDLLESPLFVRAGAIVPARVDNNETGLGSAASDGRLTLLVYPGPTSSFILHHLDERELTINQRVESDAAIINLSRAPEPVTLRIRSDAAPTSVTVDGNDLGSPLSLTDLDAAQSGWHYDAATRNTWVRVEADNGGFEVQVR